MMPLFWVVFGPVLPLLVLCSGPDSCVPHESISQRVFPVLESLQCHNDYQSYVHCCWREGPDTHTPLELWIWNHRTNSGSPCVPYGSPRRDAENHNVHQCRNETKLFAIGINHTFFFKTRDHLTSCSSAPRTPLDLSQHLSVHPPVKLSAHASEGGGQLLRWSSPYPTSSSLNRDLTYQLSYRRERQDNWTTEDLTHTHLNLEADSLLPGCRYEARVRARGKVGQWSDWTPLVTWRTAEVPGQVPSLQCVLEGEKEVMCSWEVKRDLALFVTYQLTCRPNQTAPSERCCVNSTVSAVGGETVLRYSCSLTVPDPAHLLLELIPTRNAKTFKAIQHIHPNRPLKVWVKEKQGNWMVEWTEPPKSPKLKLYYEVRYCNTQNQEDATLHSLPEGSMSLNILGASLAPSQTYQVQVRSLVVPGEGSRYEGTPSEWSEPVQWTSHAAVYLSLVTMLYIFIGAIVTIGFFILYCSIPACQRKAVLWVESVPNPEKSKALSEIKSANSWSIMKNENTYICKVENLKSFSTCSPEVFLWPTKDTENNGRICCTYGDCHDADKLSSSAEKMSSCETSSVSFTGPYISCQDSSGLRPEWVDVPHEDKTEDTSLGDSAPSSSEHLDLSFSGSCKGYVCLPNPRHSTSTEDLVSHGLTRDWHSSRDCEDQDVNSKVRSDKPDIQTGLSSSPTSGDPPAYTPEPFTPWPAEVVPHSSGYCRLP